jgi:hypothetical protein
VFSFIFWNSAKPNPVTPPRMRRYIRCDRHQGRRRRLWKVTAYLALKFQLPDQSARTL